MVVEELSKMNFSNKDVAGFLFQYPDTDGSIENLESVIQTAKKNGVRIIVREQEIKKSQTL